MSSFRSSKSHPLDARRLRGLAIVSKGDHISKDSRKLLWHVPSQSKSGVTYEVRAHKVGSTKDRRLTCTCPDNSHRGMECKHIHAVRFLVAVQEGEALPQPRTLRDLPPAEEADTERPACPSCACSHVVKVGQKAGKQYYRCRGEACGRKFVGERPTLGIKGDARTVCLALDLYYKGVSLRKLAETLADFHGVKVDHTTLYRWIRRFTRRIEEYASTLQPELGENWNVDEMKVKFTQDGGWKWLWHVMDRDTRYLIASRITQARFEADASLVFREAREHAAKVPRTITSDGLHSYKAAAWRELRGTDHFSEIHLTNERANNNIVERVNGTTRERQKTVRGVKKTEGIVARGHPVYYNHARPHTSLGGMTPAEAAGLAVPRKKGEPRWAALLRASHDTKA